MTDPHRTEEQLLQRWVTACDLAGLPPVSGDLRDNPLLALIADTRAHLKPKGCGCDNEPRKCRGRADELECSCRCHDAHGASKDVVKRLPKLCEAPGCCVSTFNAYCERHQPAPPDYLLDAEIQAQGIDGMTHEIKRLRAENTRLWLLKRPAVETTELTCTECAPRWVPGYVKHEHACRFFKQAPQPVNGDGGS
jgi:hypothetical protein